LMLVVGLKHHRKGFASCHTLIYYKNHTGLDFQPIYLYSSIVHKPSQKTENEKGCLILLLRHPLCISVRKAFRGISRGPIPCRPRGVPACRRGSGSCRRRVLLSGCCKRWPWCGCR